MSWLGALGRRLPWSATIRVRLTLWYVAILAGVLLIYGASTCAIVLLQLRTQVDHLAIEDVETVAGFLSFSPDGKLVASTGEDSLARLWEVDGGKYFFGGNNVNTDAKEQAKLAPFAGKYVAVSVTMTSARYGTGPTSDVAVEGLYSGGDRPATRELMYEVVSVAIDPTPDPREGEPQVRGRGRVAAAE